MEYRSISAAQAASRISRAGTDVQPYAHQAGSPSASGQREHLEQRHQFEALIQEKENNRQDKPVSTNGNNSKGRNKAISDCRSIPGVDPRLGKSENPKADLHLPGQTNQDPDHAQENGSIDLLSQDRYPVAGEAPGNDQYQHGHLNLPDSSLKSPVECFPLETSSRHSGIQLDQIENLIQGQVQRLLVNPRSSAWQATDMVQIQLQEQLLPGTSLRLEMRGMGHWQLIASCRSEEVKDILQNALPQLKARFKDRRLGDLDIPDIEIETV